MLLLQHAQVRHRRARAAGPHATGATLRCARPAQAPRPGARAPRPVRARARGQPVGRDFAGARPAESTRCALASSANCIWRSSDCLSWRRPASSSARAGRRQFRRGGRGGGAPVGDEFGDGEVGLVADPGHDRDRAGVDRARQPFVVERPQVLDRAAAAAQDEHVAFIAPCRGRDGRRESAAPRLRPAPAPDR